MAEIIMNIPLKRWLRGIAFLIILIFGIVFTLLNPGLVNVNFVFRTFNTPLSMLMFICFAIGMILGLMIGYARAWWRWFKAKKE
jgi:uncharacterized integral membrane protein